MALQFPTHLQHQATIIGQPTVLAVIVVVQIQCACEGKTPMLTQLVAPAQCAHCQRIWGVRVNTQSGVYEVAQMFPDGRQAPQN